MFAPFKTGDKIRLITGRSPIMVLECDWFDESTGPPKISAKRRHQRFRGGWFIRFMYCSAMSYSHNNEADHRNWREAEDFVFYDNVEIPMNKLYQTKGEPVQYGTYLAINSKGRIVLEMKGTAEVKDFAKNEIEEVKPFTVALTRFEGGHRDGETRHYQMDEGTVAVDDVLLHLSNGNLWKVTAINTKHDSSTQSKNGFFKLEGKLV